LKLKVALIGIAFGVCCLSIVSCSEKQPSEYHVANKDVRYKVHEMGGGDRKPKSGNFITLNLQFSTVNDSIYYRSANSRKGGIDVIKMGRKKGGLEGAFKKLVEGDSVTLRCKTAKFYNDYLEEVIPSFMQNEPEMKLTFRLEKIQTAAEYEEQQQRLTNPDDEMEIEELVKLSKYLEAHNIDTTHLVHGIYVVKEEEGSGEFPVSGEMVRIRLEGRSLEGKLFFSSLEKDSLFEFQLGVQDQMVKGLEIGLRELKEGAKAKIIIPSQLGFSGKGSLEGIIPPYTTVIYNVEMIKIKRDEN
jgi:FKBP-type peptidyl-prolyl cis-trans isomerase FkpA